MPTWQLDPAHSSIEFAVRHMMVSNVRGRFRDFSLKVDFDPEFLELGHVEATVLAASIDTGETQRDGHLRSADFLDAATFPNLTFMSTGVRRRGPTEFNLDGTLTIRDQTRPVTFFVDYHGEAANLQGGRSTGFSARAKIKRSEWGLTWNAALEAGGVVVGDEIKVELEFELVTAAPERVAEVAPDTAGEPVPAAAP